MLTEVGRLAKKYNATIVNGGDTHNTRGLLKTSSVDILTRHFQEWRAMGLRQIINIGNHDQEDRAGEVHPMRAFADWPGWRVADQPEVIDGIAFFPYMPREDIQAAIAKVPKSVKDAVVHWGIQGAKRNDWNTDTDGVPVEWLKKFRRVFSGHYHFRNAFENVQYIGSPYQQNHSEANQAKGAMLYDPDKNRIKFIEIEGTPKYYEVTYAIGDHGKIEVEGDLKTIRPQDHVKVRVSGDSESVANVTHDDVGKYLKCDNLKFDRQGKVKSHSRLEISASETETPLTLMKKYADFVDTSLDRKKLMQIGSEIVVHD